MPIANYFIRIAVLRLYITFYLIVVSEKEGFCKIGYKWVEGHRWRKRPLVPAIIQRTLYYVCLHVFKIRK